MKNPYKVPPFDPNWQKPQIRFYWWSWHPKYPNWSKSCWGGETEEEAWAELDKPFANSLRYYHNKLIREGDGKFVEVADLPCREMQVWQAFARETRPDWIRPTDAKPIEGWDKE
jgi:hypothetical protein